MHLPADSASRIRTLAKFVEKDYEKIAKLTKLRTDYALRMAKVDAEIAVQRKDLGSVVEEEEMAEEWFSRRLDAGLFCLQVCALLILNLIQLRSNIVRI